MQQHNDSKITLIMPGLTDKPDSHSPGSCSPSFGASSPFLVSSSPSFGSSSASPRQKTYGVNLIQPEEIEITKDSDHLLGMGGFGIVYRGIYKSHGNIQVAVKCKRLTYLSGNQDNVMREASIMQKLSHPNILMVYGIILNPWEISIVTEYMPLGSLGELMRRLFIPWPVRSTMLFGINNALCWLHKKARHSRHYTAHGDIKMSNILVDSGFTAKLSDFETASWNSTPKNERLLAGTVTHLAPELFSFSSAQQNEASDVYSFGVTLLEVATGENPYKNEMISIKIVSQKLKGVLPVDEKGLPKGCPSFLWPLVKICVDLEPSNRPRFADILSVINAVVNGYGPNLLHQQYAALHQELYALGSINSEKKDSTKLQDTKKLGITINLTDLFHKLQNFSSSEDEGDYKKLVADFLNVDQMVCQSSHDTDRSNWYKKELESLRSVLESMKARTESLEKELAASKGRLSQCMLQNDEEKQSGHVWNKVMLCVGNKIGTHWKNLLRVLLSDDPDSAHHVEEIAFNHSDSLTEQGYQCLQKWIQMRGYDADLCSLIKALQSEFVGRKDLADEVTEECRKNNITVAIN